MNSNQFRQLLDFAIEYLPEAQQARAHDKEFGKDYRRINHGGYNRHLLDTLPQIFQDPTLTAIEFAAAELLQALCVCRLKFPEVAGIGITPQAKHGKWMRKIAEATKALEELTGKKISFDYHAHDYPPAEKGEYVLLFPLLEGYWDKPVSELPIELRARVSCEPIKNFIGAQPEFDKNGKSEPDAEGCYPLWEKVYENGDFSISWDTLTSDQRQNYVKQIDDRYDPAKKGECLVGWYDHSMDARTWWDMQNVAPKEAAMVLCRLNPLEKDIDPERIFVDADEKSPDRYRLLLRVFEDEASVSPMHRTLMQWRAIAEQKDLRYHSWIDEYALAMSELEPQQTSGTKVEAGTVTSQSGEDDTQLNTTNLVYWRAVLYSNIKKIDEHKKASVREVIKYLRGLGDKRLPNKGTPDELFWIDDMGDTQCVQKKAVSNAASDARKLP